MFRRHILVVSVFLLLLSACAKKPKQLSVEQAVEIARPYFQESHGKSVTIERVGYERISQHERRNVITVTDGQTEYSLILDENNRPLSDDVSSLEIIKSIDLPSLGERIKPLGLKLDEYYDLSAVFSDQEMRYIVNLAVDSADRPMKDRNNAIYSLLGELKSAGIDYLVIIVKTPGFLLPKMELGHGAHGLQLAAEFFSTGIDEYGFEEKYYSLADRVYWDRGMFDKKISELTQLGYKHAYFRIGYGCLTSDSVEIILYCESAADLSDEKAKALLVEMDESYIKIGERKTVFTLESRAEYSLEKTDNEY